MDLLSESLSINFYIRFIGKSMLTGAIGQDFELLKWSNFRDIISIKDLNKLMEILSVRHTTNNINIDLNKIAFPVCWSQLSDYYPTNLDPAGGEGPRYLFGNVNFSKQTPLPHRLSNQGRVELRKTDCLPKYLYFDCWRLVPLLIFNLHWIYINILVRKIIIARFLQPIFKTFLLDE